MASNTGKLKEMVPYATIIIQMPAGLFQYNKKEEKTRDIWTSKMPLLRFLQVTTLRTSLMFARAKRNGAGKQRAINKISFETALW